jgi:4-hydroxy-tetrahydrodipicolinate synthase
MFELDSLKGIVPPIATPLTPDEKVDATGMRNLVNYLIEGGVHGLFVLGSTGEFPFLRDRERVRAVEAAVEASNGRVPVIAGISTVGTQQAIEHCRAAQKAGADFVVATAPFFGKMRQDWIYDHLCRIVSETGARLLLYNVPQITVDVNPDTIARLAEVQNIVGMKDSADLIHIQDVLFRTRGRNFHMLAGLEYHVVAALLVGAHGATPSPGNIWPQVYVEMYDKTLAGKTTEALALQERANRFVDVLDSIPSWTSTVKAALALMGICGPTVAAPAPLLTSEETELLRAHLKKYQLV